MQQMTPAACARRWFEARGGNANWEGGQTRTKGGKQWTPEGGWSLIWQIGGDERSRGSWRPSAHGDGALVAELRGVINRVLETGNYCLSLAVYVTTPPTFHLISLLPPIAAVCVLSFDLNAYAESFMLMLTPCQAGRQRGVNWACLVRNAGG